MNKESEQEKDGSRECTTDRGWGMGTVSASTLEERSTDKERTAAICFFCNAQYIKITSNFYIFTLFHSFTEIQFMCSLFCSACYTENIHYQQFLKGLLKFLIHSWYPRLFSNTILTHNLPHRRTQPDIDLQDKVLCYPVNSMLPLSGLNLFPMIRGYRNWLNSQKFTCCINLLCCNTTNI